MNTWGGFLSRVRAELDDTGGVTTWSDEVLFYWLTDALADYSLHNPLRKTTDLTDKTGASYDLPVDLVAIDLVETPQGTFLKKRETRPNVRFRASSNRPHRYWVVDGKLVLEKETEEAVSLAYRAIHPSPSSHSDNTFSITVPQRDIELLSLYVRAKAYSRMRGGQANLDRFALGSGDRDDNPVTPEVESLMKEYRMKIAERYSGGVIVLHRS
jgi:hypothetical protein